MTEPQHRPRMAGGIFLAIGTIGGVVIGASLGEPSLGFLAGLAIGIAAALLVWLGQR